MSSPSAQAKPAACSTSPSLLPYTSPCAGGTTTRLATDRSLRLRYCLDNFYDAFAFPQPAVRSDRETLPRYPDAQNGQVADEPTASLTTCYRIRSIGTDIVFLFLLPLHCVLILDSSIGASCVYPSYRRISAIDSACLLIWHPATPQQQATILCARLLRDPRRNQ